MDNDKINVEDILIPTIRELDLMERRLRRALSGGFEPIDQAADVIHRLLQDHLKWLNETATFLDIKPNLYPPHELLGETPRSVVIHGDPAIRNSYCELQPDQEPSSLDAPRAGRAALRDCRQK